MYFVVEVNQHLRETGSCASLSTFKYSFSPGYFSVPINSMCSRKWAKPGISLGLDRDPVESSGRCKM